MGVCLPLRLTDLFPTNDANRCGVTKTTSVAHSLEGNSWFCWLNLFLKRFFISFKST